MNRTKVTSSNIQSVGYDASTKRLEVEFAGGAVYSYEDVTPEQHNDMMIASSVGSYFAKNIRKTHKGVRES